MVPCGVGGEAGCGLGRTVPDRSHEAIAAAHDIDDVARARLTVAQCLAQCRDMDPKVGVLDHYSRPYAIQQFLLGHRLAGAFQQRTEDPWRGCRGGTPCRPRAEGRAAGKAGTGQFQCRRSFRPCEPLTAAQSPHQISPCRSSIDQEFIRRDDALASLLSTRLRVAALSGGEGANAKLSLEAPIAPVRQYARLTGDPPPPEAGKGRGTPCVLQRIAGIYRVSARLTCVVAFGPRFGRLAPGSLRRIRRTVRQARDRLARFHAGQTITSRKGTLLRVAFEYGQARCARAPANPRRPSPVPATRCPIERRVRSHPLTVTRYRRWR